MVRIVPSDFKKTQMDLGLPNKVALDLDARAEIVTGCGEALAIDPWPQQNIPTLAQVTDDLGVALQGVGYPKQKQE